MFSEEIWLLIFFIFGALLGSFANVFIYRWPRGESVIKPRSYCYSCKKPVAWFDNIPIFTWFILRGKCRYCKAPYSFRYAFVEALMGAFFALTYWYFGLTFTTIEVLVLGFGLITSSIIDLDHMLLPDEFTLSGIVLGLLFALVNPDKYFLDYLIGMLVGGGSLWLLAYLYFIFTKREGMGGGDIKLLAWLGAFLGWKAIPFIVMTSAIIGSIIGIAVGFRSKEGFQSAIPFGPFLSLAGLMYVFGGENIANWYLALFLPALVQ